MLNFAAHPDTVQARVHREIDNVVGRDRLPTWEDRKQMPYTLACVWEMERWKTAPTLGISRMMTYLTSSLKTAPRVGAVEETSICWRFPSSQLKIDRTSSFGSVDIQSQVS
ncbi:hypothetical protein HPB50_023757 [Hyalomma asiaticum]|uniref:Uncharacterized protein n=1 Tax=Hyalomma asiaticum TaxID=266040 RepID=A0ACB7RYN0_HYAAI|nr:hypothetical protein HPB50_023757 [Hyalomma asiaticum]